VVHYVVVNDGSDNFDDFSESETSAHLHISGNIKTKHWSLEGATKAEQFPCSNIMAVFTALRGMQTRSSDENSVCLSVCRLSNACIMTKRKKDKTKERLKIDLWRPDFCTMRKIFSLVFLKWKMVGADDLFYLKFWVKRPPLEQNRLFSTDIRS